ncbi:MAG: hypothetical protein UY72_C0044G0010 [Candidatus Uhrbacteria bacterium GW2011_GWD2_52_7]|uniref:Uncharacterized protein n=1 Tax=Candidatus Uhrbacteria bacterium GW2011_GWD2_52_7 TaxID=1618989 RepID=A0A0G1XDT7_9BACT|nr:MAG: hypothetical protein UY72_C0044G0010 [Candidatus Uhrbacteria bacterium GW2011_GWD2_52_7]
MDTLLQVELAASALRRYFMNEDAIDYFAEMRTLMPGLQSSEHQLHVVLLKEVGAYAAQPNQATLRQVIAALLECRRANIWEGIPFEVDDIMRHNVPEYAELFDALSAPS